MLVAHDILMTMMERRLKKWTPHQKFGDIFLKDYMVCDIGYGRRMDRRRKRGQEKVGEEIY